MSGDALAPRPGIALSDEQKLDWLRLIRTPNVGPATFRELISRFGTAADALEALPELASKGGSRSTLKITSRDTAKREMEAARRIGASFLALGEPKFPELLRALDQTPPLITVLGNADAFKTQSVAIVGSRNASAAGQKFTERLAQDLGRQDYLVVSGLARGIDTAAHRASLGTGTVAVFAGGLDVIFPPENEGLASQIVEAGGILVSEMPMGWNPRAKDFPRRNRIVAGLSLGVVVVEAARRSGSLITARMAAEAGRVVCAVPGSPLDPRAEGANDLIRQGATLIGDAQHVIEVLEPMDPRQSAFKFEERGSDQDEPLPLSEPPQEMRQRIIGSLGPSPVEVDDLVRFSGATPGEVQLVLLELSIAGRLERHGGNRVSLTG